MNTDKFHLHYVPLLKKKNRENLFSKFSVNIEIRISSKAKRMNEIIIHFINICKIEWHK